MLEMLKEKATAAKKKVQDAFAYESLASEPQDKGATARLLKPSDSAGSEPDVVPEVQGAKGKVYNFLTQHENEYISYDSIARGSGTAKSKVGKLVSELESEGLIVKVASRPRHGTVYQIIGGGPNSSKVTPVTTIASESGDDNADYVNITNDLVWLFIRETRTTDVLLFLTWLERKLGGKNA